MKTPLKMRPLAVFGFACSLLVCSPVLAAENVLVNPGFETGTVAGWTGYGSRAVESTNALYYNGGNPGGSNVLSHSGQWVGKSWGQFNGGFNINGYYQDAVAGPGSLWSAEGWGLTHQQDYVQAGIQFWFEVSFRDSTDALLGMFRSHVFDTDIEVVSSNEWLHLAITNELDVADPYFLTITNTTSTLRAPPGTAKVRFQVAFAQLYGYPGGSLYMDDLNLTKLAGSDPDILTGPASQTKVVGQSVSFSVSAAGATALSYQWKKDGEDLAGSARISGVNGATLTLTDLTLEDAGAYTVVVTDQAGSVTSVAAQLTVLPLDQATNLLVNRGFETGADFPWTRFNGGGLATTNNLYYQTADPVEVRSGLYVSQTYGNGPGSYNGLYQDAPASPGQGFLADGWFLLAAQDALTGASEAWLEVQFMNASDGMLALYKSDYITTNGFPSNTWVNLKATNIIAFWGDYSVVGQANYLIAPENTAKVRYQVTFHALDGGGSIWYDDMRLLLKKPVAVTTQRSGNNLSLSFPTQIGVSYEVRYKTDLADAEWQLLTTVTGDGNTKTISDPVGATKRFYRVTTL